LDGKRREFISLLGGAAVWPLAAYGQGNRKLPTVGFLYPGPAPAAVPRIEAFVSGLRAAGYRPAEQFELVSRIADGDTTRISFFARELTELTPNVIVAVSTAAARAVRSASATIPIIAHDLETDPVAAGLVASLARPGGNVTGYFLDFSDFRLKLLQLLQEAIPNLSTIAVLWDPATGPSQIQSIEAGAQQLQFKLVPLEVHSAESLDAVVAAAHERRIDALLMLSSPMLGPHVRRLAELTLRYRLPSVTLFPEFARAGGLIAYGPNLLDTYRQVGMMVVKVLQGTRPADLPVELPTRFELVVNLTTAKALNLPIPASILLRADEVIE
jgi:putative ABC transport system substrate-binding protein